MTGICVFSPYNHTHNKQQKAGLLPVSSVTGGSNPAVSPGKTPGCCHSCYSSFLSLSLSVSLYRVNGLDWRRFSLYGRRKKTLEFIEIDLLYCLLQDDKPGLHLKISLSFVFLLYVFLSIHPVPRLVWCLQLSRQLTAPWQVLRMTGSGGREGGRGTNERDSHSRGLSLHLQITALPTLFDICPKWPGHSIFSLYQWGGGMGGAY